MAKFLAPCEQTAQGSASLRSSSLGQFELREEAYERTLRAPPSQRPRPFEIILDPPQAAPQYLQEQALLIALESILRGYRSLMSYAPNL